MSSIPAFAFSLMSRKNIGSFAFFAMYNSSTFRSLYSIICMLRLFDNNNSKLSSQRKKSPSYNIGEHVLFKLQIWN